MREILFRGRRSDNGEWVKGFYTKQNVSFYSNCPVIENIVDDYEVEEDTVGQYIGLVDKNGTKIFEGDICRFREWERGEMLWIGEVHYEHQQFVISGGSNEECKTPFYMQMIRFIPKNIEVIGNIYDNPELMKSEE